MLQRTGRAEETGAPGSRRIVPPRRMRSAPLSAAKTEAVPTAFSAEAAATERASGGHARRLTEQAGHPAGMELVAKKELVETSEANVKSSPGGAATNQCSVSSNGEPAIM